MQDMTTPDNQSALNGLLGNADGTSLIPDSLATVMMIGFVIINIISILFIVLYIISLVRKWKVQTAIFHMQADLAEIKAALVKSAESSEPPESPQLPPKPGESSRVIATELPDDSSTA
jgi:hypothetical protein